MPPDPIIDEEEDYASSEDSDFAPDDDDAAPGVDDDAGASSDEDDGTKTQPSAPKRKQAGDDGEAEDAGFENSGDEAVIEKGKKRRKKESRAAAAAARDEEGGEGGLIKTRSMRAVEKAERKAQAVTGPVTIDVDALWASMTTAPVLPVKNSDEKPEPEGQPAAAENHSEAVAADDDPSEMVKIKRTYKFAGKTHTEEKLVQRDSAEARLYLASLKDKDQQKSGAADDENENANEKDQRIVRKAFRSAFEPALLGPDGNLRADLDLRLQARTTAAAQARKLNTVEKSRMDWAGFVDKEGIKDELALAGRAKGAYAEREGFLARTEARREEDARRVRLAGKV